MGHVEQTDVGEGLGFVSGGAQLIGGLVELFGGGPKKQFDPRDIPRLDVVSAQQQHDVELRINTALIAGDEPSAADLAQLESIKAFRASQAKLFQQQQELFPAIFQAFGIPLGTLVSELFGILGVPRGPAGGGGTVGPGGFRTDILRGDPGFAPHLPGQPGQVGAVGVPSIPGRRPAPGAPGGPSVSESRGLAAFLQCLVSTLLPTRTGGSRMPFVTTAGFAPSQGSLDFGGFGGLIQSGLNLASKIFSAPESPASRFPGIQPAGFASVLPRLPAIGRSILPGFAGGATTQGLIDLFTRSGGADTLDENAAFTDPVPGACRPKAHVKMNPCTGKGIWFVPRGRPLVFSGDMSACKRVDRVAKRLDKARPKRRAHHHHPR